MMGSRAVRCRILLMAPSPSTITIFNFGAASCACAKDEAGIEIRTANTGDSHRIAASVVLIITKYYDKIARNLFTFSFRSGAAAGKMAYQIDLFLGVRRAVVAENILVPDGRLPVGVRMLPGIERQ